MANVLILGATSAIAADIARLYREQNATLYLIGRNPSKLDALASELGPCVVGSVSADLNTCQDNESLIQDAIARLGEIDVAVIAHGLIGDQLLSERDLPEAELIFTTNYSSPVSLLIPLGNYFEQRGAGNIAVLSSVAGDRGRPRNYSYGAAKGALNLYLQGLRSRLWPNIGVHTIRLGPVHTPMTTDHPKNRLFANSPAVAKSVLRAIESGAAEAYVPWYWRPIMATVRNLPEALFQRIGFVSNR